MNNLKLNQLNLNGFRSLVVVALLVGVSQISLGAAKTVGIAEMSSGPIGTGGGDMCEERIKEVRNDIIKWIRDGGPQFLDFNQPGVRDKLDPQSYSQKMLSVLAYTTRADGSEDSVVKVGCTDQMPRLNGQDKVCLWTSTEDKQTRKIEHRFNCHRQTLMNLFSPIQQYKQINHEYAGFVHVEPPNDNESSYFFSSQLSESVDYVQRLVARPIIRKEVPGIPLETRLSQIGRDHILRFKEPIFVAAGSSVVTTTTEVQGLALNVCNVLLKDPKGSSVNREFPAGDYRILDVWLDESLEPSEFGFKENDLNLGAVIISQKTVKIAISSRRDHRQPHPEVIIDCYSFAAKMLLNQAGLKLGLRGVHDEFSLSTFIRVMKKKADFIPAKPVPMEKPIVID